MKESTSVELQANDNMQLATLTFDLSWTNCKFFLKVNRMTEVPVNDYDMKIELLGMTCT